MTEDPRATALATYLRQQAAQFSMSADVNDAQPTAEAGMALLDAAALAQQLPGNNGLLLRLSEAGCFETMPNQEALFRESPAIQAAVQRSLTQGPMSGAQLLQVVVTTALGR